MENKAIELAWNGETGASRVLHQALDLLKTHGRDVLDESDEILHAKYQLIYTLGSPTPLDGGALRWRVAAAVLASVARHACELVQEFGQRALLPVPDTPAHQFPESLRLLAGASETQPRLGCSCYQHLCRRVLDDFLAGAAGFSLRLRAAERQHFQECVLNPETEDTPWAYLADGIQPLAQLLRGLLSHEVLLLVLSKRYRVDYGAHPEGVRRMAVPYRAKDAAAERAEFGHPDVAMMLSILTYYRGGLCEAYLDEVFWRLQQRASEEAASIYERWTNEMKEHMPEDLRKWSGVNLDNRQMILQRLYPLLRRHTGVVDFWLDEIVFPVEAKCFPQKITSTAWDLCTPDHVTTGFSGTDDTRLLLPLSIQQINLPSLACTNGIVLRNLLQKDNNEYTTLRPEEHPNGQSLLSQICRKDRKPIDVLLDAGAWVTDMSNEELASKWLELRTDMEAVVFFGPDNDILVMTRAGWKMSLATSPYEASLKGCLVYLDDVHTRGSDFHLSPGTRAAVTLGRRMQKDKLVQTCMRMRLLGQGHTVSFYASFEVDQHIESIRRSRDAEGGTSCDNLLAILSWCLANTAQGIADNLPYWAAQGVNRFQKKKAYLEYNCPDPEQCQLESLAKACAEDERWCLEEMYGHTRVRCFMPEVVASMIQRRQPMEGEMLHIVQHVKRLAANIRCPTSLLQEEQERELEAELEEERQIERPPAAKPARPQVSAGLLELAAHGRTGEAFEPLDEALKRTSFPKPSWNAATLRVTLDFVRTVEEGALQNLDCYLRPVVWLLQGVGQNVLISNFEAEAIASIFMKKEHAGASLQLVAARLWAYQAPLDDKPLPIAAQVFAGSLHGEAEDMSSIGSFLGLSLPIPRSLGWTKLFENNLIATDGFVQPKNRARVGHEDQSFVPSLSPFAESPVTQVRQLYEARHLGAALLQAPVARLLGV
ncbi:unnamed protein product [Symbiodinium natans]|uniref:ubiquitinyl hydrolase 1 n=1 Tax=Symbiodinium natans TaxID=878477 RepID=A0A812LS85_9DINO|nr:unnamed protein product [Symbiodinium natans]